MTNYIIGEPFEYRGEEIIAIPEGLRRDGCKKCYFLTRPCIHMDCSGRTPDRNDKRQVIFMTTDQYLLMRVKGQA